MRKYETVFVINPELNEDESKAIIEKVRDLIKNLQGEVLKIEEWGAKKLAYEVRKMSKGYFVLLHFMGNPGVLSELERNLLLMDAVLKHQTVRLDEKAEKTAEMLSREKTSEKIEQPEQQEEEQPARTPQEEEMPQEVASEQSAEATAGADEPEGGKEEEDRS
jgi:small subunit ribosomal protein S6